MKTAFPEEVTADELAALIGVTTKTIRNHAERGVVVRAGRGKYLLAESIRRMLADARKGSRPNDLHREQLALVREKRRSAELRNAEAEGRVIDLSEAEAVVDAIVATFRVGLDGLPAKITRDVSLRKQIKAEADAILLAASRKFAALSGTHNNETMTETDDDE